MAKFKTTLVLPRTCKMKILKTNISYQLKPLNVFIYIFKGSPLNPSLSSLCHTALKRPCSIGKIQIYVGSKYYQSHLKQAYFLTENLKYIQMGLHSTPTRLVLDINYSKTQRHKNSNI